ncbi:acetamidase/formamidase family protein [Lysinibacillus macroides]|uniref:Acetamidase n=1 Tax=Lysinibacillus macroides TaxID=33935 RepID=A0A0N0UXF9_9BACI|nr:acetamidase/formamidase family protein [Lysinibacillus macroides]KOY83777.1 acetamidase [Lysinibacillus macroides]QPR67041.1 acetamidase/formamidase family protein [Lysinibacillus macroides]
MANELHVLEKEEMENSNSIKRPQAVETLFVNEFINGILDPVEQMLGPVKNGGTIIANTTPGCWGPMLTPTIRGGHEVTKPVFVEGAEVGDAIVINIQSIQVTSLATSSGHDEAITDRFIGDPFVSVKCPGCGKLHPSTVIKGIGRQAIRCSTCDTETAPFKMTNGYTMAFDHKGHIGVTVGREGARRIALDAKNYMRTPENSVQNPVVALAPSDLIGVMARMRPFLGQLGTTPSKAMPDSHNAGDFGSFLIGAPHEYAFTQEELDKHRTDGHMDISRVREGATIICPVKVPGGGVYIGDMHAMQGDGEIAGHTTDVAGIVQLQVSVLKKVALEGPILLPNEEDLPYTARPFTKEEKRRARELAEEFGVKQVEEAFPVSVVGSGKTLNEATDNAIQRAAKLFDMSEPEVLNRATITGSIEIGRHPGVVTATLQVPKSILKKVRLLKTIKRQYD